VSSRRTTFDHPAYHASVRAPDVPTDDLYARLELPLGADPEAIEIAWRSLLKRHHPDVAGPSSLQLAKQINVAHDWLSNPTLRARYDQARRPVGFRSVRAGRPARADPEAPRRQPSPRRRTRPPSVEHAEVGLDSEVVRQFLDRIERLSRDELDRLSLADPPPIAFVASIRRFVTLERAATLSALESAVEQRLPPRARRQSRIRQAILSYGQDLVLERFLEELLSDLFRERVHERMTRGWQSAVDKQRYGPNSAAVDAFLQRTARLAPAEGRRLVEAAEAVDVSTRPWPPGTDPVEDDVLRVSAELAVADVRALVDRVAQGRGGGRLADALAFTAHILALGSAFAPSTRRRLLRPWFAATGPA
jgi:curved DNA-binding protein CbpA